MNGVDQQDDDDDGDPQTRARREHPARAHRPSSLRHDGARVRAPAHMFRHRRRGGRRIGREPPENGPNGPSFTSCDRFVPSSTGLETGPATARSGTVRVGDMTSAKTLTGSIARSVAVGGRAMAEALLDLALPSTCAACDEPWGPVCPACERDLRAGLFDRPRRSMPDPVPIHLPPVTSRGPYAGVLRQLVSAYKDDGRRDLRPVLAGLLAESLTAAASGRPVVVVPMPSSRAAVRRRGDDPVGDLVAAAAAQVPGLAAGSAGPAASAPAGRPVDPGASRARGEPVGRLRGPGRRGRRASRDGWSSSSTTSSRPARPWPRRPAWSGRRADWSWVRRPWPPPSDVPEEGEHDQGHVRAAWCATGRGPPVPHGGRKGYGRDRTPTLRRMGGGPSVTRACQARGEPSPTARRTTWTTTWTSS